MAAGLVLAWVLRQIGDQPIVYDADQYLGLGRLLAAGRIDGWDFRTYGYPAFLVPWIKLAGADVAMLRGTVFVVQVAAHLAASWLFARRVAAAFGHERLGWLTLVLVALNPYVLIATGVLLSESLSATLIAVGVGLLLPPRTETIDRHVVRDGALALVALAFSAEVRPANAILLPIGALLWLLRWWTVARCQPRRLVLGLVLVGAAAALPVLPQMLLNWEVFGRPSPLSVRSLYEEQSTKGLHYLKYASFALREHGGEAAVYYGNPFDVGADSLASFAMASPLGLMGTLAMHGFALVDQDYPFPFVTEVDPWYRWPLSIVNYLLLWIMVAGLVIGWRCWWRPGTRLAWGGLLGMAAAYAALYLPTSIEARYGLPLFTLLAPAGATTLVAVRGWARARAWGRLLGMALGACLTIGVCAWLTVWMQQQAPIIAMTRDLIRRPDLEIPVARFELGPPDRWTVDQRQTYQVRVTNLGQRAWYPYRPARVNLHVMFVGPGDAESIDSRVEAEIPVARTVLPGEQLDMDVTVTAPRKEGTYQLRQRLEIENVPGQTTLPASETPVQVDVRRPSGRGR
jgi:hypothetical protein